MLSAFCKKRRSPGVQVQDSFQPNLSEAFNRATLTM